jgi:4-amino-4-deoxy-L-arabinose transferase-like glycosyltransferase
MSIIISLDQVAGLYKITETGIIILQIFSLIQLLLAVTFIPFLPLYSLFKIKHLKNSQEKKWILTILAIVSLLLFAWLITALAGLFLNYDISATMSTLSLIATF